jgi:hypothetical protein
MQITLGGGGVARVGAKLGQADHLAERHPLRWRDHGDAEPAVLGCEISHGKAASEAADADPRPREPGLQRQRGVELADLQHRFMGAGREAPRPLNAARVEPGKRRDERGEARDHADLAVPRQRRRSLDGADKFYEASEPAAYRIRHRILAIRSVFAEPRDGGDAEAGLRSPEFLVR